MNTEINMPTVIDLYAGVGGMSLGAARAGFEVRAAVELDRIALGTHTTNFPEARHLLWDVASTTGAALLEASGLTRGTIDGLVGGPPCQGFSNIGKRNSEDPRNSLFCEFFRVVDEVRPRFFIAENVPGILAERNKETVQQALSQVSDNYIILSPTEVAAHQFGAPTTRTRVFFVGYDPNEIETISESELFAPEGVPVYSGTALQGLPKVRCDWQSEQKGWRKINLHLQQSEFHQKLIGQAPHQVGAPEALERLRRYREVSGNLGTRHTNEVIKRFRKVAPGTTDSISRAPRLAKDGFCPTLRAGTDSERGSFQAVRPIHFSSPRVITPREAARLQGFPDWFQFHKTKWHSFRQIGNSVSPIVAEVLLRRLRSKLPHPH